MQCDSGLEARVCTLDVGFAIPGYREMILGLGYCGSSKEAMEYLLK